jgi:ABC-2 type transport system permease protein
VIGAIIGKELRELRRDGRLAVLACLIGLLVAVALVAGWAAQAEQRRQASRAQRGDSAAFLRQGQKAPHAAAHFGRMAYRSTPPLALFDPGATAYLGQVIWLEAHTRNPAMFRPAEDAPELRRLWDLSVAGVLTLLVPLLVFAVGHGCFAGERERGTLRQVVSAGAAIDDLFAGKVVVAAGVGIAVAFAALSASIAAALAAGAEMSFGNILARGALLALGYGVYAVACGAVALLVSSLAGTARSALLVLLGLWAVSIAILPRVAASAAERLHPAPDSQAFWADTRAAMRARRPARDSDEYRAIERRVLGRALGREVSSAEATTLEVNRIGLALEVSEVIGAEAMAAAYSELHETHARQRRARRLLALFSPAISLQHLSSALAGTDVAAHEHFELEAERQRGAIIRAMNEDMIRRGAGRGFSYLAEPALWANIPDFAYRPPPASAAAADAAWDLLALASWAALALWLARRCARQQRIIR